MFFLFFTEFLWEYVSFFQFVYFRKRSSWNLLGHTLVSCATVLLSDLNFESQWIFWVLAMKCQLQLCWTEEKDPKVVTS